jgi:hypothetical protein
VRAVDPVEYPTLGGAAGLRSDLLTYDGVVGSDAAHEVEHCSFGVEVDLRDRGAVGLVGPQLLAREVGERHGVSRIGERERQRELTGPRFVLGHPRSLSRR